ncbi:MAG: tetraacyldisaccharide 4'-kinase, partial [Neisseriaceae bacterium]|nr:tetraacyldisaccharide 4'-kinase [Neisseriaceae bacterium]
EVDVLIFNGSLKLEQDFSGVKCHRFEMNLRPTFFWQLATGERKSPKELLLYLQHKKVRALAGIGFPLRFFQTLKALGFDIDEEISYPDHYWYQQSDVPDHIEVVIMSSKDAVKWRSLDIKALEIWILEVEVFLTDDLLGLICKKLKLN